MRNALRDGLILTTFGVVLSVALNRALTPNAQPPAPVNGLDAHARSPAPRRF